MKHILMIGGRDHTIYKFKKLGIHFSVIQKSELVAASGQALGSYLSGQTIQCLGLNVTLINVSLLMVFTSAYYLLFSQESHLYKILFQIRNR